MKNLIIFLSLFISSIVSAEMKPLQEETKEMDPKQIGSLVYISQRCTALFLINVILEYEKIIKDFNPYFKFGSFQEFHQIIVGESKKIPENTVITDLLANSMFDAGLLEDVAIATNLERHIKTRKTRRGTKLGIKKAREETWGEITVMIKNYQKISKDHFLKSGERINSLIESDLSLCKPFLNSVRDQQS